MSERERERVRRVGLNEALFREVNERLVALVEANRPDPGPLAVLCECGNADCDDRIQLDGSAYERVRSDPLLFVVLTGHELPDVEDVVEREAGYNVVRKRGPEAEKLAERTNPRSRNRAG
jgi:hypothetical protein